jgi:hypothetical protein
VAEPVGWVAAVGRITRAAASVLYLIIMSRFTLIKPVHPSFQETAKHSIINEYTVGIMHVCADTEPPQQGKNHFVLTGKRVTLQDACP